jgi:hypothetical protein
MAGPGPDPRSHALAAGLDSFMATLTVDYNHINPSLRITNASAATAGTCAFPSALSR